MLARYLFIILALASIGLVRLAQRQTEVDLRHTKVMAHRQVQEDAVAMRIIGARIAREISNQSLDQKLEFASLHPFLVPMHDTPSPYHDPGDRAVAHLIFNPDHPDHVADQP
ncbi:MAG: hypothetical protein JJU36_18205 [Phycisphaeraceae bacterium]|nr:hypothetical protein [Phycisphaeraceae bacterium]